jgi:putative ABC transport system permease protein
MLELAWASLRSRALSVGLTVLVITLSVVLLLGVERVRTQRTTKASPAPYRAPT